MCASADQRLFGMSLIQTNKHMYQVSHYTDSQVEELLANAATAHGFEKKADEKRQAEAAERTAENKAHTDAMHQRTLEFRKNLKTGDRGLVRNRKLEYNRHFEEALRGAAELIAQAAWFAEAWNQRAIAYYSLGRYPESIHDCQQALEINPYHFGAAAGMGQCHVQLGEYQAALECFRRALRLNPSLEGVRANIAHLERAVEKSESD